MAGTCSSLARHVVRSSLVRTPPPSFSVRISARSINPCDELALPEGPSCIFVGPIETVSKETLEALYRQGLAMANSILFVALGSVIGIPIATASVGVLQGLWRNDLVALKGACPNCGEEVFAFVRSDQSNSNQHKVTCHVCESSLEFRTKVESSSRLAGSGFTAVYT